MANVIYSKKVVVKTVPDIVGPSTSDVIVGLSSGTNVRIIETAASTTGAKVQFTTSPLTDIINDTAIWTDWSSGVVTATTEEVVSGDKSGVRVDATDGTWTLEVCEVK